MSVEMRWGFVGASDIAGRVIESLRKIEGAQPAGICSGSEQRAREFAQRHGLALAGTDLRSWLEQGGFDAIYISSTNQLHAQQTLAALRHGCHVLCEKPLAMSEQDARDMVRAAAEAGRVLATNHHLRGSPANQRLRELVASGELGEVHSVQVSHAVYLPRHLQGWRLDRPDAGGGVLLDILVHDADVLRFVLQREPRGVISFATSAGMARAGLEDNAMSVLEFEGGVLAQCHESFVAAHAQSRLHLFGTRANVYSVGALSQAGSTRLVLRDESGEQLIELPPADVYENTLRAFTQACAGHGAPLCTGADGLASLRVALGALESSRLGRRVEL
jgi:1,5-anhydro-D-fructose reductase (1,5-anhydro-D-mannitol-forming)